MHTLIPKPLPSFPSLQVTESWARAWEQVSPLAMETRAMFKLFAIQTLNTQVEMHRSLLHSENRHKELDLVGSPDHFSPRRA